MTRLEMLESIKPKLMLKTLLKPEQIEIVSKDVQTFYRHNHKLPMGVLNAILFLSIMTTGDKLFNVVYLRKVAETFKDEGAITTAQAINKLDTDLASAKQRIKNQPQKVSEPDWLPGIINGFSDMGDNKEKKNETNS